MGAFFIISIHVSSSSAFGSTSLGIRTFFLPSVMYGPYITDGKKNVRIPKDVDPKSLDELTCIEMIKNAPKRRARRTRAKK